jgi:hypothetical protein
MTVVNVHTGEIVETSTALRALDPAEIDAARDPGAFVVLACERAKAWLAEALDKVRPEDIAEFKSQAEAIRVYTVQKNLGKDAQLSATEIVRRAERGLGLAIRRGQAEGSIRSRETPPKGPSGPYVRERGGRLEQVQAAVREHDDGLISPRQFFDNNSQSMSETYAVTDGVTDEQFESALTEAKAEGNLSRANVVRKAKRENPRPAGRPEHLRKTRHHDANRIVAEIVNGLEGYVMAAALIDVDQIDRSQTEQWSSSLSKSLQSLNRLNRQLKELDLP